MGAVTEAVGMAVAGAAVATAPRAAASMKTMVAAEIATSATEPVALLATMAWEAVPPRMAMAKLSPAGMPQPEVAGLPSDHELHGAKDDKPWEKLLNEHLGAHFPAGDFRDHLEHKEAHESDHGLPSQHWDAHSTAGESRDHPEHKEPHEGDHALLNQHLDAHSTAGDSRDHPEHKEPHEAIASTNIFTKRHNEHEGHNGHRERDRDDQAKAPPPATPLSPADLAELRCLLPFR